MTFIEWIGERVVIGDGGWGTMLAAHGLPAGTPPELWTLEHPEAIAEIASAYVEAGAELVTTNTFGGSPMRLAQHRMAERFEDVNRLAVAVVRAAIGNRAFISASIGPTGRLLEPFGDADPREVLRGFTLQARLLAAAGCDLVCIETMTDLQEAELAVRAVRSVSASLPIVACMTFDLTPRGPHTMMGVSVPQAATTLAAAGANLVGANCGTGVEEMQVVARAFLECSSVPVAVQPNAGLPVRREGEIVHPESPEQFAAALAPLAAAGVRLLGGCCGTTPAHIAALRQALVVS